MEAKEVIFFLFVLSIVCIFLVLPHFASKPLYVQWFIFSLNMSAGLVVCFLLVFFFYIYTYFCSFILELRVFSSFCLRHHGAARVLLSSCRHSHMSDRAVSRYFVSSSMWDSCCHMGLSRNMQHCLHTNTIC